jgi:uncharacterized iron-regulated membrane protein
MLRTILLSVAASASNYPSWTKSAMPIQIRTGIRRLHRWAGLTLALLVAWLALTGALLFALVVVIGGIVTWWPGSIRALRAGLTFSPRLVGRARLMNQHRVLGIWISFVLLASALTGPIDSFSWYRHAIEGITRSTVPEAVPSSRATDRPRLSIQALAACHRPRRPEASCVC